MTREDAVKELEIELNRWEDDCKSYHAVKEALQIAIEALENENAMKSMDMIDQNKQMDKLNKMSESYQRGFEDACRFIRIDVKELEDKTDDVVVLRTVDYLAGRRDTIKKVLDILPLLLRSFTAPPLYCSGWNDALEEVEVAVKALEDKTDEGL